MKKPVPIAALVIIGAVISFSIWPVLAGTRATNTYCPPNADCAFETAYNKPQLLYKIKGWQNETNTINSRSEYCTYYICSSEARTTSVSIVVGSIAGLALGILLILARKKTETLTKLRGRQKK